MSAGRDVLARPRSSVARAVIEWTPAVGCASVTDHGATLRDADRDVAVEELDAHNGSVRADRVRRQHQLGGFVDSRACNRRLQHDESAADRP